MLRLLRFLLTGDWHLHKWKLLKEARAMEGEKPIGSIYYLQCVKCGNTKQERYY